MKLRSLGAITSRVCDNSESTPLVAERLTAMVPRRALSEQQHRAICREFSGALLRYRNINPSIAVGYQSTI
jgi:hypothetical protein